MLTLYVRTGCPFCAKVLRAGEDLGLEFDIKNVAEPGVADELLDRGGKQQEPYLIDEDRDVALYEADDIVQYLETYYGTND